MSNASKLTLLGTSLSAVGIIFFVHWAQQSEKAVRLIWTQSLYDSHRLKILQTMHAGVVRDIQQQKVKAERKADFEMQRQLEDEYRKIQTVSDGSDGDKPLGQKP